MFFDSNDVQLSTYTNEVTQEDTAAKYKAWGWNVLEIDGHNYDSIRKALTRANDVSNQPTLIIGKTIIGKGCVDENGRKYEGYPELHGSPLSSTGADYKKTLRNLGAYPDKPFEIYSEVAEYYQNIIDKKSQEFEAHQKNEAEWRFNNPKLAKKLDLFMSGELPEIDFGKIKQKNDIATRAASAQILGFLADHLENLIVASADLANSDKTDGYLKKVRAFKPHHFDANFVHSGVSEFSMVV